MLKRVSWLVCVALLQGPALAFAGECGRVEGRADEKARYSFVPQDERWMVFPFGWHATAQISCENCNSEGEIGAYAWLSVGDGGGWGLVGDNETEFMTLTSSMWFSGYQGAAPVVDGEKEPIRWNDFAGHARRFVGLGSDGQKQVLIGAWLTDGCASIQLYTAVGRVEASPALRYLRPMLAGVRVERR